MKRGNLRMEITPGTIELQKAAQYMAENLAESIWKRDVMHTHALYAEIDWNVVADTIHILYNYYGMFPDMGVGKGVSISEVRGGNHNRKRKVWYSITMYREVARLAEKVAEMTGLRTSEVVGRVSEAPGPARIALSL